VFAWLLALVPAALALRYVVHAGPLWIFLAGALAIVPLAEWISRATGHVAQRAGGAVGGLLNVTFGNVAELILALFVLQAGQAVVVKGQITGSIIGNGLLGFGLAIVIGSWGRRVLKFRPARVSLLSSLVMLALVALLLPALFDYTERGIFANPDATSLDERLSLAVAVVLILVYGANLAYTLVTHRDVFAAHKRPESAGGAWPLWQSIGVLLGATAVTAWMAELVSGALEDAAQALHVSTFFLGVIVLAIIGNAAEYVSSARFARQNRMGLVATITVGSTIQVALLTAPVLVIVSHFLGQPMNLVFDNPLELIAIASVALIVNAITRDGEATWFEGVMLIAVYALLAFAFFFATPPPG
jgi:Ca2+:H+ antiporter